MKDSAKYSSVLKRDCRKTMLAGVLTHLVVVVDVDAPEHRCLLRVSGHLCVGTVGWRLGPERKTWVTFNMVRLKISSLCGKGRVRLEA